MMTVKHWKLLEHIIDKYDLNEDRTSDFMFRIQKDYKEKYNSNKSYFYLTLGYLNHYYNRNNRFK